jgi:hypothetical protein
VFIQIIQGKCRDQDKVRALGDRWAKELAPGSIGWLGGTYGFTDDDQFVGVVRFDSRDSAAANGARSEQTTWWQEMESCFDGPVAFHNCDDVTLMMGGGSDDAGFIQVIQGKVDDPAPLKELMGDTEMLHQMRPEILGATLAIEPDGTFTETVAFTDEASARKGEQQPMPEQFAGRLGSVMQGASFYDLHKPWFESKT